MFLTLSRSVWNSHDYQLHGNFVQQRQHTYTNEFQNVFFRCRQKGENTTCDILFFCWISLALSCVSLFWYCIVGKPRLTVTLLEVFFRPLQTKSLMVQWGFIQKVVLLESDRAFFHLPFTCPSCLLFLPFSCFLFRRPKNIMLNHWHPTSYQHHDCPPLQLSMASSWTVSI